jgi:hypothetical protein
MVARSSCQTGRHSALTQSSRETGFSVSSLRYARQSGDRVTDGSDTLQNTKTRPSGLLGPSEAAPISSLIRATVVQSNGQVTLKRDKPIRGSCKSSFISPSSRSKPHRRIEQLQLPRGLQCYVLLGGRILRRTHVFPYRIKRHFRPDHQFPVEGPPLEVSEP